jgi:hypothetical protein
LRDFAPVTMAVVFANVLVVGLSVRHIPWPSL